MEKWVTLLASEAHVVREHHALPFHPKHPTGITRGRPEESMAPVWLRDLVRSLTAYDVLPPDALMETHALLRHAALMPKACAAAYRLGGVPALRTFLREQRQEEPDAAQA